MLSLSPACTPGSCGGMLMWPSAILSNCPAWHSAKCQKRFASWQKRKKKKKKKAVLIFILLLSCLPAAQNASSRRRPPLRMTILTLFLGERLGCETRAAATQHTPLLVCVSLCQLRTWWVEHVRCVCVCVCVCVCALWCIKIKTCLKLFSHGAFFIEYFNFLFFFF